MPDRTDRMVEKGKEEKRREEEEKIVTTVLDRRISFEDGEINQIRLQDEGINQIRLQDEGINQIRLQDEEINQIRLQDEEINRQNWENKTEDEEIKKEENNGKAETVLAEEFKRIYLEKLEVIIRRFIPIGLFLSNID